MRLVNRVSLPILACGFLEIAGCSHPVTSPSRPTMPFKGTLMGTEGIGTIAVTIANPPVFDVRGVTGSLWATGTVREASGFEVTYLAGTYDTTSHALVLVGPRRMIRGTISEGRLQGTYAVDGEPGAFVALEQGVGADAVRTFDGVYGDCGNVGGGFTAGLGIRGTSVAGVTQDPGTPYRLIVFVGTFSPADSSLQLIDVANPDGPPLGTGRVRTDAYWTTVSVRFVFTPGDTCRWSGWPTP